MLYILISYTCSFSKNFVLWQLHGYIQCILITSIPSSFISYPLLAIPPPEVPFLHSWLFVLFYDPLCLTRTISVFKSVCVSASTYFLCFFFGSLFLFYLFFYYCLFLFYYIVIIIILHNYWYISYYFLLRERERKDVDLCGWDRKICE